MNDMDISGRWGVRRGRKGAEGGVLDIMHGRRRVTMAIDPTDPYITGTEQVGFSPTRADEGREG